MAGSTLSSVNFFNFDGDRWTESRYDVADRHQEPGIGAIVGSCNSSEILELRLADNFKTLKFDVGQANDSEGSDQILTVEVLGNGEQKDIRRVPFNKIQPFSIDVTAVNALKILFYLDSGTPNCGRQSVVAVLHGAVVQ